MYRYFIKRVLDIVLSLFLLPFVFVIVIPVSIAIKIEDKGPIFYNAARLGKNMKPFTMYKIRSMKVNAQDIRNEDGTTFSSHNDLRVTKVGKFIRKTSVDELPQFLNVLKGDMSFIGPRPSPLGDKSIYPKEFFKRYEVVPGITGYNQSLARNCSSIDERISNDSYYIDNMSFIMDMKIIFMTVKTVLSSKNIYRNSDLMEKEVSEE